MKSNKPLLLTSLTLLTSLLLSTVVQAKDLTHRLGVGYANQSHVQAQSLSARYYMSPDIGFSADLGIKTGDTSSAFSLLAKVYKVIFPEDNLNFYMAGGLGLISQRLATATNTKGPNNSGFEIMALLGVEFFIPGIESIGWTFEAGIGVASIKSDTQFHTIGHSPINAGMIFYF